MPPQQKQFVLEVIVMYMKIMMWVPYRQTFCYHHLNNTADLNIKIFFVLFYYIQKSYI